MMTDDITDLVQRAAGAVPDGRPDLSAVLRRHRVHRRRRAALVTVAAAVAVIAVTGVTAGLTRQAAPKTQTPATLAPPTPAATPTPAAQTRAQRLPLDAGWALGPDKNGAKVTVHDPRALLELRPDQRLVANPVPAVVDIVRSWVALDDGRSVVLGGKDLKPGVQRQDGPNVTDYAIRLLILSPDAQVKLQREVRIQGQDVQLIGANATTAYLYRTPGRVMAHDLATGTEQRLTTLDPLPDWAAQTLSVQGGLLFATSQESCKLTVTALDTGQKTATDLRPWACPTMRTARLSPDGRTLAIAVSSGQDAATVSLLKIDVAGGQVTRFPVSVVARDLRPGVLGVAWAGTTVRVAWLRLPAPGVHPLSESIQVTDVP